jgi:WD40 repeat protein
VARDGLTVASGSADGKVRVWEARTCRKTHTMHGHTGKVHSVAFAPDGVHLASTCTSVRVWRIVDGECVAVMKPGPKGSTSYCCGFSNTDGGQWLVAGVGQQRLVAWNWRRPAHEGGSTRRIGGHTSAVWSCSYNAADTWVVSSSLDQTAQVSDAVSGAVLRTFACVAPVVSAMFLGDGSTHVVSCGRDHVVRLWEISTQRTIGTFEGHAKAVFGMAWHGSAHLVTCGEDGTCCLWKLPDSILFDSRRDQPGTR